MRTAPPFLSWSRHAALSAGIALGLCLLAPGTSGAMTLNEALQRVADANREVASARRAVQAAQADVQTARVTPPPQLSVLSQAINPQNMGHGGLWSRPIDTIVRLDQPIERGHKRELRSQAAQAAQRAADAELARTVLAQQQTAAQAYWDLKLAQVRRDIAQRNADISLASSKLAQERLKQGDLSRLEATRLAVEAERAASELGASEQQWQEARWALARLLSVGAAASPQTMPRQADLPDASQAWPDAAQASVAASDSQDHGDGEAWLSRRADVQAAQQRLEQADAAVALAQAQTSADVTVSVQFEHYPPTGERMWGVGLAIPLGMEGRQQGPLARALVAQADAQSALERVRADALAEQAVLRSALRTAGARAERLRQHLLPQAQDAVKATEFARWQGAMALQDVLDARRVAHTAELDTAQAQADFAKALSRLTLIQDPSVPTP
ncbi:MAG: TolC family protein [Proteobacteria bacterium]|uniref:TolC family protein n=1 Tax=Aquabacterium sp. TaxID=1872578 RepID=UPI0035C72F28|nr:TolC family protein [Pseudomonadota bacterium]